MTTIRRITTMIHMIHISSYFVQFLLVIVIAVYQPYVIHQNNLTMMTVSAYVPRRNVYQDIISILKHANVNVQKEHTLIRTSKDVWECKYLNIYIIIFVIAHLRVLYQIIITKPEGQRPKGKAIINLL